MDTAEGLEALCLKAGKGSTTIGVELVIEFTDDECVEECSELFFREHDPPLERFNPECARRLGNLQILSLSRNRFSSLEHFRYFSNLLELNLNFNRLTVSLNRLDWERGEESCSCSPFCSIESGR